MRRHTAAIGHNVVMIKRAKRLVIDRLGVTRIAAQGDRLEARVAAIENSDSRHALSDAASQAAYCMDRARIEIASAWAASAPLLHSPTISIVLATRNRHEMLRHAIDSVLSQSYAHWELVIVDDASTDATPSTISEYAQDARIVGLRTEGTGAATARNRGLEHCTGEYITFIDDDNVMAPGWLRAVVEYTGRVPECTLLYGAQIRQFEPGEEELLGRHGVSGLFPLFVDPFDRGRLLDHNYIDLGVVVVKAPNTELRFDDGLKAFIDWEMLVRLTASDRPHPLAVVASLYRTAATSRISELPERDLRLEQMRQEFARRYPQ